MEPEQEWILLVHLLPPRPTNLRVRTWRRLQKLGAIAIKNSVYLLPFDDKTSEDFQWLKQEIESAGGEATVFRAGAFEGATNQEIIALFRNQRDQEYEQITAEMNSLAETIREQGRGKPISEGRIGKYEAEFDRLHKELERIISTDFFNAPGRAAALAASERCRKLLRASQSRKAKAAKTISSDRAGLDIGQYQGRRWITRHNLFVDRLASIWLIKRFIDKRARFLFVAEGEKVEGGICFDMYGAELTHRGEDCTFETMIKQFGLGDDAGLRGIAEIVHDIDLKDNKFNRSEAPGLNAVLRGLADLLKDDRKLVQQCSPIFDGLHEMLARSDEKKDDEKPKRSRAKSRSKPRRRK